MKMIPSRFKSGTLGALALASSLGFAAQVQAGAAFVHLFEWKWNDVAAECEDFLGPKGFEAVQISPPNEHIVHDTWWARYQPVSYKLNSRSGTEQELRNMIERCHAAGVKIYADLVFNQTAVWGDGGTGTAGTRWTPRNHPGLYGFKDYHNSGFDISASDYANDAHRVWIGKLTGLPDLNTGSDYVRQKIADYVNKLKEMGVDGFRIDASKHIAPGDVQAILEKAGKPWAFLEVIGANGEASALQPPNYTHLGLVTEFKYGTDVAANFRGQIKYLRTLGKGWGLLPSDRALVFIDNHDRERGHGGGGNLTYKDGPTYNLANVFMLAFPYGYPKVHSGYKFDNTDAGPPGDADCEKNRGKWACQHRWGNIANMVSFRNHTIEAWSVDNWWDNGNNAIAFGRGDKGFVVINNDTGDLNETLSTGLPPGEYCNILAADKECSGGIITIDGNGRAHFELSGKSAAAIHGGARP
uniref:Alpha-amylase n=1 Tax=Candidatus Kentrum sp. FM TaxID=2126340 RepID=A0A450VU87_9GAMM|nr:MAG: alpha-amylase [Candidatus Kentron sp. FM]VFJ49103.1 MAG: alpha-amylase [Candidatus Kentron sp. FM]VFK08353.1 MAG: alpha-amylase [Candidatus Kentron sp. FM]